MELKSATVLVTGGTGFLGSALVRALLAEGVAPERLRCLVRDPHRAARAGVPAIAVRQGDITQRDGMRGAAAGADVVFHLAGTLASWSRRGFSSVNVDGTEQVLRCVLDEAPGARFIHVSSLAAAGPSMDGTTSILPPERCQTVSAYGESKRLGELLVVRTRGLRWLVVRPPAVYGPGDAGTRLLFRQACLPFTAVPRCAIPLSIVHIDDVVRALLLSATAFAENSCVPLDGPERTDSHALVRQLACACGRQARLLRVPMAVALAAAGMSDLWARCTRRASLFNYDKLREVRQAGWVADGRHARELLGFEPRVGLSEGLRGVASREGFVRS